jgi:hypothetical protein
MGESKVMRNFTEFSRQRYNINFATAKGIRSLRAVPESSHNDLIAKAAADFTNLISQKTPVSPFLFLLGAEIAEWIGPNHVSPQSTDQSGFLSGELLQANRSMNLANNVFSPIQLHFFSMAIYYPTR